MRCSAACTAAGFVGGMAAVTLASVCAIPLVPLLRAHHHEPEVQNQILRVYTVLFITSAGVGIRLGISVVDATARATRHVYHRITR